MISVLLGFKDYGNLFLFAATAVCLGVWVYRCMKQNHPVNLALLCLVNIGIILLWSRITMINPDEAEHLHCSWMVSRGMVPFVDFWQHHSPLVWVMMAPFMKVIPQTTLVFDMSRLLGTCMFVLIGAIGWDIARTVWGKDARWQVYVFLLTSVAALGEYTWLRPDIFNVLFLVMGVRVSLDIPARVRASLLAGISFGLAMAFTPKQFLLCFLPLVAIIGLRDRAWGAKVFCFSFGILVGLLPLGWYLIRSHIVSEYLQWVVFFNQKNMVVSVYIPLANVIAGIWAMRALLVRYGIRHERPLFILMAALILSAASGLIGLGMLNSGYYLACLFVLIAAAGSPLPLWEIAGFSRSIVTKAALAGIFLAVCMLSNIYLVRLHEHIFFEDDKKAIARILAYSRGDRCVVLLPLHPVFVRDATRLFSRWQFQFAEQYKSVRTDVQKQDMATAIISAKPAIVACRYARKDFILELYQKKLITAQDYKNLIAYVKQNYTETTIGENSYYIRNDLTSGADALANPLHRK